MPGSDIIPDSQLVFSAELAVTLGLEGAVLLQQLQGLYRHLPASQRDGLAWLHVSRAYLQQLLPFWSAADLEGICAHLEARGLLHIDRRSASSDSLLFAMERGRAGPTSTTAAATGATAERRLPSVHPAGTATRPLSSATSSPSTAASAGPRPATGGGEPLPRDFIPSEDMLELLARFHNVPRDFALQQVEDFTLYWRERGTAGYAWQNKFRQHVLFQWARYQQSQGGNGEHAQQQGSGEQGRTRDRSLAQDLSDTSWAE